MQTLLQNYFLLITQEYKKNFFFIEDELPRYKQTKKIHDSFENKINLINWFSGIHKFIEIDIHYKACIVRDPLKRFISAFKNRILFHKDDDFYNHSIDMIIEKLENGFFDNKHFLPQNYFLGKNLNYFDIVGNTSRIEDFEKKINNFFGKNLTFPKIQTGGKDFKTEINDTQIAKIKKIYSDDYDLISGYI